VEKVSHFACKTVDYMVLSLIAIDLLLKWRGKRMPIPLTRIIFIGGVFRGKRSRKEN